ncbi:hypothetical protein M0D44_01535 [Xanthomonas prunicola]|uniref:hypothetical protein n=1 Tax=Xanthomonas prunicola TaxID=2053930 RepID=UPI0021B3D9FD|nr:hypothetical protein [Xanthomonas prunicola]UXA49294.1 hypothetical protein M0D44_01535 [Xanthomonas prunicola]
MTSSLYDAFEPWMRVSIWHTSHSLDEERLHLALFKAIAHAGAPLNPVEQEDALGALDSGGSVRPQPSRAVPILPELIRPGFLDHMQSLVKAHESQLSPKGKIDVINDRGNWITKAIGNYLKKMGSQWPPAKRGFYSLRKSIIQELQGKGVASEMRAQIVGHELDDKHHAACFREFIPREKLRGTTSQYFATPGLAILDFSLTQEVIQPEAHK